MSLLFTYLDRALTDPQATKIPWPKVVIKCSEFGGRKYEDKKWLVLLRLVLKCQQTIVKKDGHGIPLQESMEGWTRLS